MTSGTRSLGIACVIMIVAAAFGTSQAADDEQRPAWTSSKLKGTPNPPAPYAIQPAYPNLKFDKPTSITELPGRRMLVTEIGGAIYTFPMDDRATAQPDLLLRIDDSSIWHATAHPGFALNGQLFVCYSRQGTSHVSRFQTDGLPAKADPNSEEVLLTWPAGGHNAGCLQFGTDGMLYISTGDGSGPNPPDGRTAAQDVSNLFGCVLRIDVDHKSAGLNYVIPADNPFVDLENARPEIWSYGLRNPWKFGIDSKTGNIFAADNGWESWEMVHQIVRGGNCGWPIMEGRAILRSEVKQGPTPIRPPIKDHPHTEANSVIGGPVYRGTKLTDLDGTFVYGDYITGTIWGLTADSENNYTHRVLVDTDQRITGFAEGSKGELFVLDYDYTGQIYELLPSGLEDLSATFPRRLSETGLFTSTETMEPAPGVVEYDVIVKQWVDGAAAKRWVAIPGEGSIRLADGESPAEYPDGTVFVKHLTWNPKDGQFPDVPIETQVLHYEHGTWHPYSYVWDNTADGDAPDATLVDSAGTDTQVVFAHDRSDQPVGPPWHVSAENECRMCHNAGSGFVLGFTPHQLDRSIPASTDQSVVNQLAHLARQKAIAAVPAPSADDPGRLVDPHDESNSLDDRARSYLHGNCSSCHHPGGNAIVSFYLRRDMPFDKLNTNKGTGIGTFGMRNAKLIVPGDPYRSVLLYRMSKLGYARMPYIGSRAVDGSGVSLIEEWIRAMPHQDSEQDSALVRAETPEAKALELVKRYPTEAIRVDQEPTRRLLESTEGALALASAIHKGEVGDVGAQDIYASSQSDIRGLFEDFVDPGLRRKTLGRNVDPQTILSLNGDPERGRLIFFSDGARCRNCHDVDNAEKSTGPTLMAIRKQYKLRSEMLQHILNPSLKVDDKFAMWTVLTESGKVHSGLLISQSDGEVLLRTAEQKTISIPRSEIEDMVKSNQSLMPSGILSDLTAQEAADLTAWFGQEN